MLKYTELASTNRQNLREVLPLAKPFTLLIEPTSICNFRCIQCFQSIKTDSYFTQNIAHMPLERFCHIIEQLRAWPGPKLKVLKLSLYGEPLASPDFPAMLALAREADIAERIETTTNASLLTPAIADAMVAHGLDYLRVSIYATEQLRHQEVTGSKFDINKIQENLLYLQEAKRKAGLERPFISCKMLDDFSDANQRFFEMFGGIADEVYLDKPHTWIRANDVNFMVNFYKDKTAQAVMDFEHNSTARVACPMPFTTMAVRSNGMISPCCVDYIGGTNIDSMENKSLQEVWESPQWLEFQIMHLENRKNENSSCGKCDVFRSDHYTKDNIDGVPIEQILAGRHRPRPVK